MISKVLSNSKSHNFIEIRIEKPIYIYFFHEILDIPGAINFDEVSKEVCFKSS